MYRTGINDKLIIPKKSVIHEVELNPRDIETRQGNGKYYVYRGTNGINGEKLSRKQPINKTKRKVVTKI